MTNSGISAAIEQLRKALEPIGEQLGQIQASMATIAEQHESIWKDFNEKFKGTFQRAKDALEKAECVGALGWTLPMSATPAEYGSLVERSKDVPTADDVFTVFYTSHQSSRLATLKTNLQFCNQLEAWKPLLGEAIFCLENGKYRSCTASLLPMIDGFSSYKFSQKRFHNKGQRQKFFKNKLQAVKPGSMQEYMWRSFRPFIEMVFHYSDFNNPKPSFLNRHWILHGRSIPDSNLSDCLRLLQAIETISKLE